MNIIQILLIIVCLITASFSFIISRANKDASSRVFSIFILSICVWTYGVFLYEVTSILEISLNILSFNYVIAMTIASLFLQFSLTFPFQNKLKLSNQFYIYLPSIILTTVLLFDRHFIIQKMFISEDGYKLPVINSWVQIEFMIVFCLIWIFSYYNLYKSLKNAENRLIRSQLKFIIYGTLLPLLIASYFDLFFASYNFRYIWVGPLMAFIVVYVMFYAIYKHQLFNVRLIVAEIITFLIWIIILIRILISETLNEMVIESLLLCITILFGIWLIHTVLRENRQKEQLADLNLHLEQKVAEQTLEVRQALEIEKKAHNDLEKLNDSKNQFIMITQHHLRTPVTSINWQLESITSGAYGPIAPALRTAVTETREATKRLTQIINEFLSIAALKAGSNILNLTNASLKPIINEVLTELRIDINQKQIRVNFDDSDESQWPALRIDQEKMRDILLIVIENAIRYNDDPGKINIKSILKDNKFQLSIENTGIGISSDEIQKIGTSLFYRGEDAKKVHVIGMGVGLSAAKAIIKGHHGQFEIYSQGKGQGAKVVITLPIAQTQPT